MNADTLVEHLESSANAITAFMVAQSLALAVSLGTNAGFACLAFSEPGLNLGLKAHFLATFLIVCAAMYFFYRAIRKLQAEHHDVFLLLYIGRAVAAAMFVAIPVAVLHSYAGHADTSHACKTAQKKSDAPRGSEARPSVPAP